MFVYKFKYERAFILLYLYNLKRGVARPALSSCVVALSVVPEQCRGMVRSSDDRELVSSYPIWRFFDSCTTLEMCQFILCSAHRSKFRIAAMQKCVQRRFLLMQEILCPILLCQIITNWKMSNLCWDLNSCKLECLWMAFQITSWGPGSV